MNKETSIHIGTSGWVYKHWKGRFYPDNLAEKEYLKYYSEHFSTVEVNSSFYHLLKEESTTNWVKSVPDDFVFAVKASRYITHMKKLKEPESTTLNFFESIKPFGGKVGPILFQLPPKFGYNKERLESFFEVLPEFAGCATRTNPEGAHCAPCYKYAFEFRDTSWFNEETYEILRRNNAAFCIYNLGNFQSPKEVTADFVYIRLHGNYGLGSGKYSNEQLEEFAGDIRNFIAQGKDVFCYFNNDEAGYAVENAIELEKKS